MNTFLTPFVNNLNKLGTDGVKCIVNGVPKSIRLFALCCCVDSVARAPLEGLRQFNGYFNCLWCLQCGERVNNALKFPILEDIYKLRTIKKSLIYIEEEVKT